MENNGQQPYVNRSWSGLFNDASDGPSSGSEDAKSFFKSDLMPSNGLEYISERHVACVFLLDTSGSMAGDPIKSLNEGLLSFKQHLTEDAVFDTHTKACIDVAIISFNDTATVEMGFVPASRMEAPRLTAEGLTAFGAALNLGLDMITEQKARYNEQGTPYYRPWVFCITDGYPTDDYGAAARRLKEMEEQKKVLGYCVGVGGYDKETMLQVFNKSRVFELGELDFAGLFQFVSSSLAAARNSGSVGGGTVEVAAPKTLNIAMDF